MGDSQEWNDQADFVADRVFRVGFWAWLVYISSVVSQEFLLTSRGAFVFWQSAAPRKAAPFFRASPNNKIACFL